MMGTMVLSSDEGHSAVSLSGPSVHSTGERTGSVQIDAPSIWEHKQTTLSTHLID